MAVVCFLVARHVLRPLTRRISDEQIALYVEEHSPQFEGALVAAAEFRQGTWLSDQQAELVDAIIASAAAQAETIKQAMAHPNAAATIAELMPFEITSVQPGQPAPDFTLPYLPGSLPEGADHDTTVTLSDHFGKRPVALIFGSYT